VDFARDHAVRDGLDQIATWNAGMLRPEELMTAIQAVKRHAIVTPYRRAILTPPERSWPGAA
jgi:hypothetical protein